MRQHGDTNTRTPSTHNLIARLAYRALRPVERLPTLCRRGHDLAQPWVGNDRDDPALQERRVPWIILFAAGLLEIVWAFSMKQSAGFSRPMPTLITLVAMAASFALLAIAMRTLPLGAAYTIWTGIGAVGAFFVGVLVLGESASVLRILALILIVAGLVLTKLSSEG